jgi:uncharacterized cupredoxin-like copper-binding protein
MKRLVTAFALLTAFAASAQAGPPKAIRMIDKMKVYSVTHYVRGSQGGGGGGSSSMTAEARQATPAPAPAQAPASKQKPAQRAD